MTPNEHLQRAIDTAGGLARLQNELGLNSYQTIQAWRRGRVPAEYCPTIERITAGAVRCEQIRPDVEWCFLRATDCPGGDD